MDDFSTNKGESAAREVRAPLDYGRFGHRDVRDLIAQYPLALLSSRGDCPDSPSLLPLIGEYDAEGRLVTLIGHMARKNRLNAEFEADPRAMATFLGPQAYISPAIAGRSNWAPTWNYAMLKVEGEIRLDGALTEESLRRLVSAMEAGRERPWTTESLGERYAAMKQQIIGFTINVTRISGRFKLGQDEPADILEAILTGLPDEAMVTWMRRFNPDRA